MRPQNIFVLQFPTPKYPPSERKYLRKPLQLKPSACTPLFLAAFERGAQCCIHTHSQWAVLVTLLVERELGPQGMFEISNIEQIKGIPRGRGKGMLGFFDTLKIPIIENTAFEEDLTGSLEKAMDQFPDTYAVLVRRHGMYVSCPLLASFWSSADSIADMSGETRLPKQKRSVRVWTTCSSWQSRCTNWAFLGQSSLL